MLFNKKIFLIGMPGCGKTRKGKYLADKLNIPFFDTDKCIEKHEQMNIADIFALKGELYFRTKEKEILHQLVINNNAAIIATGGGLPCFEDNMNTILQQGISINILHENETLATRLFKKKEKRPLLQHLQTELAVQNWVENTLMIRKPWYNLANFTLYSEHLSLYDFYTYVTERIQ